MEFNNIQEAQAQTDRDRHLLLELHIKLPDENPREQSKIEVHGGTPSWEKILVRRKKPHRTREIVHPSKIENGVTLTTRRPGTRGS